MKWILIFVIAANSGLTSGTAEFDTENSCIKARDEVCKIELTDNQSVGCNCLQKGEKKVRRLFKEDD